MTTIYPYATETNLFNLAYNKTRFPRLLPNLKPENVAADIIKAQRKEFHEISLPREGLHIANLTRIFPKNAVNRLYDFVNCRIEPDE